MCQDYVRFLLLPEVPFTLCITGDTVCVCVFDIACSPHPPLRPPDVHSPLIKLVDGATPTCVKIASDPCPRLHPPCVTRDTVCVCVCV